MKQLVFAVAVSCLALGCSCSRSSSDGPAGPASSAGTSAAQPPAAGGEVARPTSTELPALSVGQWSKYRNTTSDGTSDVTYKVVAEEDGGYWLEIVRGAANAGTVLQLLISVKNRSDPNSLDVQAARVRMPNGHVRELRGDMLRPTADGYRKALAEIFVPALAGAPQEDVTVSAGTFRGCYKRTQKVERQSKASEQTVWVHTAVPISGIVKSEETDGSAKTELLTWGTSGAKSELNAKKKPE
jgi:hypothetical protein